MRAAFPALRILALGWLMTGAWSVGSDVPPAHAQSAPSAERVRGGMFDASDPQGLARFMTEAGFRAEATLASRGAPVIRGRLSKSDYAIQFYECENGAFCNSIQFLASARRPPSLALEEVNAFNARWRYVRLSIADGQARLQMDVNLDAGVTADNFEDTLDIWRQLLEMFERDILQIP